jgi:hypothetical protein
VYSCYLSFIKAFIGSIEVKTNGKHCSFVHIQKFRDAVKFGAEEAHQNLPEGNEAVFVVVQERGDQ